MKSSDEINKDDYVYCTQCKHFKIYIPERDEEDITPYCKYEKQCGIYDCEDGRRYSDRPMYEKKDDKMTEIEYEKDLYSTNDFLGDDNL